MKDFNIAKYLRENSLGSHAILGAYVDLHALKEAEDLEGWKMVKDFGAIKDKSVADKYAEVERTGNDDLEVKVVNKDGVYKIYTRAKKEINKEADYGNNQPVDEVPYDGAEEKLDGFGDEFDQVDPVEERKDNSMTGDAGWEYTDEDFPNAEEDEEGVEDSADRDDRFAYVGGNEIKAGIKRLMDDDFDAREIAQFVVDTIRAFKSFKEEVTVGSSGVGMEEALSYDDLENDLNKIAIKMRKIATLNHNNAGDFTFVTIAADDDDDPAYNKKVQNAGYKEVVNLINKKYPTLKVIEKEQNFDKVSFVIARK